MTNFSGLAPLLGLALFGASSCAGAPARTGEHAPEGDRLWVLAPHPDDEVLMAGELLRRAALSHRPVTVLVMTNGDLGCERDGYRRESETIAALEILGIEERDVHFLGYPDGYLEALGDTPLPPIARTQPDGTCGTGSATYAVRGEGGVDVHTRLFGAPGPYVARGPVDDLAALLARERPREIVVAHPIDSHRDHAITYVLLRRALEAAQLPVTPTVLRAVVHQGPCWPNGAGVEPCPDVRASFSSPMPAFAAPLDAYAPPVRIASDDGGATKRRAIAAYASQLGTPVADESWLSSFARTDEVFWPETLAPDPAHPERLVRAGAVSVFGASADVTLAQGGSAFFGVGDLRLSIDGAGVQLSHGATELRRIPWAHAQPPTDPHTYELRIDSRSEEGDACEITVRRDGVVLLLAVIPRDLADRSRDVVSGAERATIDARGMIAE
jgi:LmbE family N-acetylglucosaminyl deacetylase